MAYGFLIHGDEDHVGVAVRDLAAGETVTGVTQKSRREVTVTVRQAIPLGHKVALAARAPGDPVLKYNEVIGVATAPIQVGDHVHVHNLASRRWGRKEQQAL
ncbi:MAG: UxaA family hydrolase [Firmicutes bacterium]|nr:UxaA family hydrolase [Bacillota bacterium]